jgi:methionyl-tRNA formyltransferase
MANKKEIQLSAQKIVFMGTPEIAADVLTKLLTFGIGISAVITRPDKPKGRGQNFEKSPVKILAEEQKIPVYEPKTKNEFTNTFKELKPDLGIIAAYGMIIPKEAIDIPKHGVINFHPSLLPLYRGPSPVSMTIKAGEKKTGITIILVAEEMDAGDILAQKEYQLSGEETTPELEKILAGIGAKMIASLLPQYVKGEIISKAQDHLKATFTHLVKKEDAEIFWDKYQASEIEQLSRAFTPWPGIYSFWNSKKIDLYKISVVEGDFEAGLIVEKDGKILIGTKKGAISPEFVKLEGKNKTATDDFVRGHPTFIGASLPDKK